jgi:hypothetical protein
VTRRLLARITCVPRWAQLLGAAILIAFYAHRIGTVLQDTGLFRRLGFDWGLFYSQAAALASGNVKAMYRVDELTPYLQRLAPYTATPDVPLLQWPAPYPPLLAGVIAPLTILPPPWAFGIWTALSLAAAMHLVWRASQLLPGQRWLRVAIITLTALPMVQVFVLGQPMLFLASALAESFLALRRGAEMRGGLWLGLLAFTPQYGLLLGLFLLWKRRWSAVLGAVLGVGAVIVASALVAGPDAVLDYQAAVSAMGDFRDPYANSAEMVNWRALIVNLRPGISSTSGVLLFLTLSVLTIIALLWATRGPWPTSHEALDLQLGAVIVATFLVSYHSHMHGLALAVVPLAAMWRAANAGSRLAILGFVFLPTVLFVFVASVLRHLTINYDEPLWVVWPVTTIALLVMLLCAILVQVAPARATAPAAKKLTVAPNA